MEGVGMEGGDWEKVCWWRRGRCGGNGGGYDHNRSVTPGLWRGRRRSRRDVCVGWGKGGPPVGRAHTRFPCAVSAQVPSPPPPIIPEPTHHPPIIIYIILFCGNCCWYTMVCVNEIYRNRGSGGCNTVLYYYYYNDGK